MRKFALMVAIISILFIINMLILSIINTDNTKVKQINPESSIAAETINYIRPIKSIPQYPIVKKVERKITLYDTLTPQEIHLIEATIKNEVGDLSETYQKLITEIIYNRIVSDKFPNTVEEVLYQKNQFCGIENWYNSNTEIPNSISEIVKEVFTKENPSHNAVYYYNPALSETESIIWFEYSGDVEFIFEYSEESWGVNYTTRFFK